MTFARGIGSVIGLVAELAVCVVFVAGIVAKASVADIAVLVAAEAPD
jgi:hypothetical protein